MNRQSVIFHFLFSYIKHVTCIKRIMDLKFKKVLTINSISVIHVILLLSMTYSFKKWYKKIIKQVLIHINYLFTVDSQIYLIKGACSRFRWKFIFPFSMFTMLQSLIKTILLLSLFRVLQVSIRDHLQTISTFAYNLSIPTNHRHALSVL